MTLGAEDVEPVKQLRVPYLFLVNSLIDSCCRGQDVQDAQIERSIVEHDRRIRMRREKRRGAVTRDEVPLSTVERRAEHVSG